MLKTFAGPNGKRPLPLGEDLTDAKEQGGCCSEWVADPDSQGFQKTQNPEGLSEL